MKAIAWMAYGPPEVFKQVEVPDPVPRRSPRGILMGMVPGFKKPGNAIIAIWIFKVESMKREKQTNVIPEETT